MRKKCLPAVVLSAQETHYSPRLNEPRGILLPNSIVKPFRGNLVIGLFYFFISINHRKKLNCSMHRLVLNICNMAQLQLNPVGQLERQFNHILWRRIVVAHVTFGRVVVGDATAYPVTQWRQSPSLSRRWLPMNQHSLLPDGSQR